MNKIISVTIVAIILAGCSVEKEIVIKQNNKTKELEMYIDPSVRKGGLGLYIIMPLIIQVSFPELIQRLKVLDTDEKLLWEVEYKNLEFGGHGIYYGKPNRREYIQKYPETGEPIKLERGKIYQIILKTEIAEYNKNFIYQESEIKINKHDRIN